MCTYKYMYIYTFISITRFPPQPTKNNRVCLLVYLFFTHYKLNQPNTKKTPTKTVIPSSHLVISSRCEGENQG